jgi:subtilisin family serine protease
MLVLTIIIDKNQLQKAVRLNRMEQKKNNNMKTKILFGGLLTVLLGTGLLFYSSASQAKPIIKWIPSSVNSSIKAGQSTTTTVTFTPKKNIRGPIDVRVVPELEPFVSTNPTTFNGLTKGKQETVDITVFSSIDDELGEYKGTIQLIQKKKYRKERKEKHEKAEKDEENDEEEKNHKRKTLTKPLRVKIDIKERKLVTDPEGGVYPVNEIVMTLKEGTTIADAEELAELVNGVVINSFVTTNYYLLEVPTTSIEELEVVMDVLESDPRVDFTVTNDLYYPLNVNYDLDNLRLSDESLVLAYDSVNIQQAWNQVDSLLKVPPKEVGIGIIDTGIDASHPEFGGVSLSRFSVKTDLGAGSSACSSSIKSHGTEVAGIMGANNLSALSMLLPESPQMNGIVSGVPGVKYTLGSYLLGDITQIKENIETAIRDGSQIINMSLSYVGCDGLDEDIESQRCLKEENICLKGSSFNKHKKIFEDIFDAHPNIIFIAAAGNNYMIPATFNLPGGGVYRPNLITVAATKLDEEATWADFSNIGYTIDIAAPGVGIYAPTSKNGYTKNFRGTSGSAPIVSGIVALLKSIDTEGKLKPKDIKNILMTTATPSCVPGEIKGCRINALKAVEYILKAGSIEIKRIDRNGEVLQNTIPTTAQLDDSKEKAGNPAFFSDLLVSENPHIAKASDLPEYIEKVAMCNDPGCTLLPSEVEYQPIPEGDCDGTFCTVSVDVLDGQLTRVVFLYDECAVGYIKDENGASCIPDEDPQPGFIVLDQINDDNHNDITFGPTICSPDHVLQTLAQTFTVGIDGKLAQLDLALARYETTVVDGFVVSLYPISGLLPDMSNPPLFTQNYEADILPLWDKTGFNNSFTSFDVSGENIQVTSGDILSIVVSRQTGDCNMDNWILWSGVGGGTVGDFYSAGTLLFNKGSGFVSVNGGDAVFRTYVTTPPPVLQ